MIEGHCWSQEIYQRSSSIDTLLFEHSYGYLEDTEDGCKEIIKFNFDVLDAARKVSVYKVKCYKKKLEEDGSIDIFPPVMDDDT